MRVATPPRRPDHRARSRPRAARRRSGGADRGSTPTRQAPPSRLRRARAVRTRSRRLGGLRHRRAAELLGSAGNRRPVACPGCASRARCGGTRCAVPRAVTSSRSRSTRPTRRSSTPAAGATSSRAPTAATLEARDQRTVDAGRGDRDRSDAAERRLRGHGSRRRQDDGRRPTLAHGQQRALRRQGGVAPARRESRRERRLVADHRCAASEHRVRDDGPRSVPNDQRWQALAGHRAGPSSATRSARNARSSARATTCPSRSTRTTLRPSTRAGRAVGVSSRLFGSTDGGDALAADHDDRPALVLGRSLFTASGALLGTDASRPGVYRSTDGGTTWSLSGDAGRQDRRARRWMAEAARSTRRPTAERCSRRPTAETAGRRPPPTSPTARS